jgi:dihydroorotate dehydrogenase
MYSLLRPILFKLDAERAHHMGTRALDLAERAKLIGLISPAPPELPVEVMGIRFPNPVGIAAGLDKNGAHIRSLFALGAGFVEIGTVTPRPQAGNPKPRMFRLPEHRAVINRLGFNNAGLATLVDTLRATDYNGVLGINIGRNKDTPNERALEDYQLGLDGVYPFASYIAVNISSPNTQGLRELQQRDPLTDLLGRLIERRNLLARRSGRRVPLVVKIAPDLDQDAIEAIADAVTMTGCDGLIATNTTIARDAVSDHPLAAEAGGLSGDPVRKPSNAVLKAFREVLPEDFPLIGTGGILEGRHAVEKRELGACLVQTYTGLIYRGPGLIRECVRALADAN